LTAIATPLIVENIRRQLAIGARTDLCFVIGSGRNDMMLRQLNDQYHFFKEITTLEHPGYIARYHNKERGAYIKHYLVAFEKAYI
jgi:hypothetical protein